MLVKYNEGLHVAWPPFFVLAMDDNSQEGRRLRSLATTGLVKSGDVLAGTKLLDVVKGYSNKGKG